MGNKLYVGNIPFDISESELRSAFEVHGQVNDAVIITDKMTGRPRGFGFVEMAEQEGAEKAIAQLNGSDLKGRQIVVNEARPNTRSGGGGGGGGYRGGGGGGGRRSGGGRGGYRGGGGY